MSDKFKVASGTLGSRGGGTLKDGGRQLVRCVTRDAAGGVR